MHTSTFLLVAMTLVFVIAAVHAWRLGEARRDVALLGFSGGLCGVATAATAMV